jgi:hypothetical protein
METAMMNSRKSVNGRPLLLILVGSIGCGSGLSYLPAPVVSGVTVSPNPNSVLSATVTANISNAVKAHVSYQSQTNALKATPDVTVKSAGTMTMPVFELRPDTDYSIWVTSTGLDGKPVDSQKVNFRTGSLPAGLPAFLVERSGTPQPGYTMVAYTRSGGDQNSAVIVDQDGQIVWYTLVSNGFIADWQEQPDGTYTAAATNAGMTQTTYNQLDKLGNLVRTWTAGGDLITDDHDLRLQPNGDAVLFGINRRTMDLTEIGGQPDAIVLGNVLLRMDSSNHVLFRWDTFDHLPAIDDLDSQIQYSGPTVDWTHGNAIDIASDGNYLCSFRNISQILKIDSRSGAVIWKLGGAGGEFIGDFTFVDDPFNGFSLQHAVRELPNGNLLLFDNGNGHDPPVSRAVEYQLNVSTHTARMVWQYVADPPIFGFFAGFTQRLQNGNTLISYGAVPQVLEVNNAGSVQWSLQPVDDGFIYRSFRIPSLY